MVVVDLVTMTSTRRNRLDHVEAPTVDSTRKTRKTTMTRFSPYWNCHFLHEEVPKAEGEMRLLMRLFLLMKLMQLDHVAILESILFVPSDWMDPIARHVGIPQSSFCLR